MIHKPLFRSALIHLTLLVMVVIALIWDTRRPAADVPIHIENISITDQMKKAIHRAVHTIGIPHEEPESPHSEKSSEESSVKQEHLVSESGSEGGGIPATEMQKYLSEVVNRINRVKRYPKDAQFNEQEGVVGLIVEVAPDGKILRSQLEKTTAFDSLNLAAMEAIQKIGALPPLPKLPSGEAVQHSVQLHIPLHFQLQ